MSLFIKILVVIMVLIGEGFSIYAEMIASRSYVETSQPIFRIFLKTFPIIAIASGCLIFVYALGYRNFKNIWIVSAISISSIIMIEPILAYILFHQLPTRGALIGLILGTLGFLSALFLK